MLRDSQDGTHQSGLPPGGVAIRGNGMDFMLSKAQHCVFSSSCEDEILRLWLSMTLRHSIVNRLLRRFERLERLERFELSQRVYCVAKSAQRREMLARRPQSLLISAPVFSNVVFKY